MTKIPVGETIRYAYQFAFSHLGAIIGLIWLPMVIVTVAGFFAGERYYADAAFALEQDSLASMGPAILMMLAYVALSLVLSATMYVAVIELALGTRKPGAVVHFAFGRTELRLLRAMLALIGVLLLPVIAVVGASGFVGGLLVNAVGQGTAMLIGGVVLLVLEFGLLYVALRFLFLLVPVAVAEDGRVLERAWTLVAGNFWRLLAVLIAAIGPVVLFTLGAQVLLLGTGNFVPNLSPTVAQAAGQMHAMRLNMPLATGIGFLVSPFAFGLALGAASFAYRALTRTDAAAARA